MRMRVPAVIVFTLMNGTSIVSSCILLFLTSGLTGLPDVGISGKR